MFISLAVLIAAAALLLSAFWLKFRLPGWEFALGVSRLLPEKQARVDVQRLRRYLSAVFFLFSAIFFALLFCLYFRAFPQKIVLALCFLGLLLFFDSVLAVYRIFDSNDYPKSQKKLGLFAALCVNAVFVFFFFFFIL